MRLADGVQQGVVLHVARANLEDVGVLGHEGNLGGGHDLGDDEHPGGVGRLAQQLQPGLAHALKSVGRRARFEGSSPQHRRPGGSYRVRDVHDLLAALDRAGSGHHHNLVAADTYPVECNHRIVGVELATGKFVGLENADHILDTLQDFPGCGV